MPAAQLLIWAFAVDGCHGRRDRLCHAFIDCHVGTLALPALAVSLCQFHVADALPRFFFLEALVVGDGALMLYCKFWYPLRLRAIHVELSTLFALHALKVH